MQKKEFFPNITVQTSKGFSTNLVTGIFYSLRSAQTSSLIINDEERVKEGNLSDNHEASIFAITLDSSKEFKDLYPFYNIFHKKNAGFLNYCPKIHNKQADWVVIRNWKQYQPGGEWRNSTLFRFLPDGENQNAFGFYHKECNKFVSIENKSLCMKDDIPKDKFSFIPDNFKLKGFVENFIYPPSIENLAQFASMNQSSFTWNFTNDSDLPNIINLPINQTNEKSFAWTFSKSPETEFLSNHSLKINALFYDFKSQSNCKEFNAKNLLLESPFVLHITHENEFKIDTMITVPAKRRLEYKITWELVDVVLPFKASVRVEILADRLKFDGSIAQMAKLDPQGMLSVLALKGFKGNTIINDQKEVMMFINGTINIKGIYHGNIERKEIPLE